MRRSRAETFGSDCGARAHAIKLRVRHDQQELLVGIGEQDEVFALPRDASVREW